MIAWCDLTEAAAGNAAGLAGTVLLAYGALRAITPAKMAYRVTLAQAKVDANRQRRADAAAGNPAAIRLAQSLDKLDAQYEQALADARKTLDERQGRWTRWDTVLTVSGLVLTLASDALPLAGLLCPSKAAVTAGQADPVASAPSR